MSRCSALRKASADITCLPVGHLTCTKYSSRLNVNSPSEKLRYPWTLGSVARTPETVSTVIGWPSMCRCGAAGPETARLHRLANLRPPVPCIVAGDGLQQDDAGAVGVELVGASGRQQGHVPAPGADRAHLPAGRLPFQRDRTLLVGRHHGRIAQLQKADLDLSVHDERELVMSRSPPLRCSLRPEDFQHVLDVFRDRHFLVRLRKI